jgi:membrane protease YdiL (CAAX protease family)
MALGGLSMEEQLHELTVADKSVPAGAPMDGSQRMFSSGSWVGLPANDWPPWTGFAALAAALVLAAVGGLIVDIPAIALGVKISAEHTPSGIELADTVVQDIVFVLTVILFAQLGARRARSWQLGFRPTSARHAFGLIALTLIAFLFFSELWAVVLNESAKEKLLEQLGANETALLLTLSALLTTVIAPICEETLFRGYIFPALSKWKGWLPGALITGVLFGGVHYGSAPVIDLVPLGMLGFMLCMLYRRTGSLYPGIATHSLNNSIAFGALEGWSVGQTILLMAGALIVITVFALLFRALGVISKVPTRAAVATSAYDRLR